MVSIIVRPVQTSNIKITDVSTGSTVNVTRPVAKLANIELKSINNVLVPSQSTGASVTLTAFPATSARLDTLEDVLEITPANNSTLVYDSTSDKYIVKQIDIDGGTF